MNNQHALDLRPLSRGNANRQQQQHDRPGQKARPLTTTMLPPHVHPKFLVHRKPSGACTIATALSIASWRPNKMNNVWRQPLASKMKIMSLPVLSSRPGSYTDARMLTCLGWSVILIPSDDMVIPRLLLLRRPTLLRHPATRCDAPRHIRTAQACYFAGPARITPLRVRSRDASTDEMRNLLIHFPKRPAPLHE